MALYEAAPEARVPSLDGDADGTRGRRGCMGTLWTSTLAPIDERHTGHGTGDG